MFVASITTNVCTLQIFLKVQVEVEDPTTSISSWSLAFFKKLSLGNDLSGAYILSTFFYHFGELQKFSQKEK